MATEQLVEYTYTFKIQMSEDVWPHEVMDRLWDSLDGRDDMTVTSIDGPHERG